jgi:acetyl-CoA carboxylase biotin carboxyl carrier protein
VEIEQIKELMASVESSKLKKFVLKKGDFELQLEKEGDHLSASALPPHYHPSRMATSPESAAAEQPIFHSDRKSRAAETADGKFVTSPLVGTFYASPAPDQPAFVKLGDRIAEDTVVCIIEAMKVMNEVKAGVSGVVSEILVDNAHPVEFGSKIFRIT